LHCPVNSKALVLEIGSGGNPYARANVLLDAEEESLERDEKELVRDRVLVLGLVEELPFKDKSFDFIIASHIFEHTDNPRKFLNELVRVGKAGYIETPEGWFEKMCAYYYHRLEVSNENGSLLINKKESWKPDPISRLFDNKLAKNVAWTKFIRLNPDLNHLRFYWKDSIEFEILNEDIDASWDYPVELTEISTQTKTLKFNLRQMYLSMTRWLFSQNKRNKDIDIFKLLQCPNCHSNTLNKSLDSITCEGCSEKYDIVNGVVKIFPNKVNGFKRK
jgi:SAM-dependent methyltransferase/uncharacterized protein YbaR (Trm112 family)